MATYRIRRPPPMQFADWLGAMKIDLAATAGRRGYSGQCAQILSARAAPAQLVSVVDRICRGVAVNGLSAGWIQYRRLKWALKFLDRGGTPRSFVQKQLHSVFANACLDVIFRGTTESDVARAMSAANISTIEKWVAVKMPRRLGKTWSVSMYIAAMMWAMSITGVKVTVYSSGLRASTNLAKTVRTFLAMLPGATEQITVENLEEITLVAGPRAPVRSLVSLPNAVSFFSLTHTHTLSVHALFRTRTHTHLVENRRNDGKNDGREREQDMPRKGRTRDYHHHDEETAVDGYDDDDGDDDEWERVCGCCGCLFVAPAQFVTRNTVRAASGVWGYTGGLAWTAARWKWETVRAGRLQRRLTASRTRLTAHSTKLFKRAQTHYDDLATIDRGDRERQQHEMRIYLAIRASAMVLARHAGRLEEVEVKLGTRTAIVEENRILARDLQRLVREIANATQAAVMAEADLEKSGEELEIALEGGMAGGGAAAAEQPISDAQVDAQIEHYWSTRPITTTATAVTELPAPAPAAV
jgi:hypothetical protein